MRTIPITPANRTGDVLEAFQRKFLNGADLAQWAEALLAAGFDSDAIVEAVGNPGMHWQKVPALYSRICREIGFSQSVAEEVDTLIQEVMIEEYRRGFRKPSELLHRFDDLRKRVKFPEAVDLRLLEDNPDGTNDSGYYASQSRKHGAELDALARSYLEKAGIRECERS